MITKLKKVYYCEFCKKKGMHPAHMKDHEKTCNMNPKRYCKICDMEPLYFYDLIQKYSDAYQINHSKNLTLSPTEYKKRYGLYSMAEYEDFRKEAIVWKKDVSIKMIIEDCEACPVCVLSVLKITGLINMPGMSYDYQMEFDSWQNSKRIEHNYYY